MLPNFISWGWAIWSDRWTDYRENVNNLTKDKNFFLPRFLKKYYKKEYLTKQKKNIWH